MAVSPINRRGVTPAPLAASLALPVLSRHQVRRRQRVPTVTVLAGRNDAPARLIRVWAESEQRAVRELSDIEQADAVSCWFAALVESRNVTAAAYAWLAERAGCEPNEVSGLRARSPHEQTMFLDVALGTKSVPPADAVCRAIVEQSCQNGSTTRGLWDRLIDACGGDLFRAVAGIFALVGEDGTPILHAVARTNDVASLRSILGKVVSLVSVVPTLPIVVTTTPERLEEYLASTPECRSLALVREGVVWLADEGIAPGFERPAPAAKSVAVDPHEAQRAAAAATASQGRNGNLAVNPDLPEAERRAKDDPARSAAERFLYERLQAHPETSGLFELNGSLDVADSDRSWEVDLMSRGSRVAIEIDGFYHFTDLEAYRRDRRKDVVLQHAGYFVIRCLADDVVNRLEEILATVVRAVRREGAGQGRAGKGRAGDCEDSRHDEHR
ncbi:MAG TPA: DUF559 domain-containing protein [Pirellulales bacterium]|jgi:hypothetical protein|nr:DUF559 domain-containing protein [Pirellulales bacterium]